MPEDRAIAFNIAEVDMPVVRIRRLPTVREDSRVVVSIDDMKLDDGGYVSMVSVHVDAEPVLTAEGLNDVRVFDTRHMRDSDCGDMHVGRVMLWAFALLGFVDLVTMGAIWS